MKTLVIAGKNTRALGAWDHGKMELNTHLCTPVVSIRANSMRGDQLWWLHGARRLCSRFLVDGSLGRETARRLTSFCHWLIDCPCVSNRTLAGSWQAVDR